jgi:hypothetical protein
MTELVEENRGKLDRKKGKDKEPDTKNRGFNGNREKNSTRAIAQKDEKPRPMGFESAGHSGFGATEHEDRRLGEKMCFVSRGKVKESWMGVIKSG